MFTFSFSSAFASVSWTGEATSKYLTEAGDYDLESTLISTATGTGAEGITEAYKAQLTAAAKAEKLLVEDNFYAPEEAKATALLDAYIADVAAAKTAKAAKALTDKLGKSSADLDNPTGTGALGSLQDDYKAGADAIKAADSLYVDVTRLVKRYDETLADTNVSGYFLPGYGFIANSNQAIKEDTGKFYLAISGTKKSLKDLCDSGATDTKFIKAWLMDNDYRTAGELEDGVAALVAALVPVTATYKDTVKAEAYAIQTEIYKYADKYGDGSHTKNKLTVADLEGVDALIVKMNDFNDKYKPLVAGSILTAFDTTDFVTSLTGTSGLAEKYFDQYCAEFTALPLVAKLTDADKAKVIELYNKFDALGDTYENVWDYIEVLDLANVPSKFACAAGYNKLTDAYAYFLSEDVKAFEKLDDFDVVTEGAIENGVQKYYFDASEKNVNALKAQRTAYDALVKDYGYTNLTDSSISGHTAYNGPDKLIQSEAAILAAEHNMPSDASYDVKDTTKLQNYLNNATLKVTTNALGNNKSRVQARFDADTYKDIVAECGNDYTISYQFYHKAAAAKTYKAAKVKDRNYITYTSKSLKKGTKYKFQCAVLIKDAAGNVVAQKDYKASTIGSRVCR